MPWWAHETTQQQRVNVYKLNEKHKKEKKNMQQTHSNHFLAFLGHMKTAGTKHNKQFHFVLHEIVVALPFLLAYLIIMFY